MKKVLFLFVLLINCGIAIAQKGDSLIQARGMEFELTEKSKMTDDKKFYKQLPINMGKGDVALIAYRSDAYIVALAVRDTAGHMEMYEDDPVMFDPLGSEIVYTFRAPAAGPYQFIFSSKEPEKTGKAKMTLYYYNAAKEKINSSSSFCEKLSYVASQAYTGFGFIKKTPNGVAEKTCNAIVELAPDAKNFVRDIGFDFYHCEYPASANLEAQQKKFKELDGQITACLKAKGYVRTEYSIDKVGDYEKKKFVAKVRYELKGENGYDIGENSHKAKKIKNAVTLSLTKGYRTEYDLEIEVE